jgi:hypothetical protein
MFITRLLPHDHLQPQFTKIFKRLYYQISNWTIIGLPSKYILFNTSKIKGKTTHAKFKKNPIQNFQFDTLPKDFSNNIPRFSENTPSINPPYIIDMSSSNVNSLQTFNIMDGLKFKNKMCMKFVKIAQVRLLEIKASKYNLFYIYDELSYVNAFIN